MENRRRLSLNAALWIAAVPVALAAVRVLMFSRGDTTVLRVLLETFPIVPVLMATALLILPWLYFIVGAVLVLNKSARAAVWATPIRRYTYLVFYAVGVVVLVTAPIYWAGIIAVTYAVLLALVILGKSERNWAKRIVAFTNILDTNDLPSIIVGVILLPMLISTLTSWNSFWLPRENVTVSAEVHDGYVLADDGTWTTILTSERAVLRVLSADVSERIVCDQGTVNTIQNWLLPRADDLPECAEDRSSSALN